MANASAAAQEQKLNEEQTGKTGVASVYHPYSILEGIMDGSSSSG
jgi:hypothetical protein